MENQETIIHRVEPHDDVYCLFLAFMSLLNKWSLSTYYIQMIMLDVLWDWTHTIEDISFNPVFWNIYIYFQGLLSIAIKGSLHFPTSHPPQTKL